MFTCRSLHHGDVKAIIYDTGAACEGPYSRGMQKPTWVHTGVGIGSRERAVMGLQS